MSTTPRTSITLTEAAPALAAAVARFERVAYPGRVDLVTRELVRITSGRLSHCAVCRNLRLQAAIDRGFDEAMVEHLDDPDGGTLPGRQRAAVRLTHAFLSRPDTAAALADTLHATFEAGQLAELVLDLIRYRPGSKLTVASGGEPETDDRVVL